MSAKAVVGVDVAKRTFDVCITGASKPRSYRNTKQGINSFIKSLQLLVAPFVVLEATGSYQRDLVRRLAAAGISYSVVNPRTISGRNSVPSTEVAAARIEYVGDGYTAAATRMGWLQRFFLSVSPI